MSVDLTLELRQAIVTHLRADTEVSALLDERVYGEKQPANTVWPFARYGYDTMAPFNPQCISGGSVDGIIHTFAKGDSTDEIKKINAAINTAIDGTTLDLDGGGWCYDLNVVRVQTLPEGSDGFHGLVHFNALTGREAA